MISAALYHKTYKNLKSAFQIQKIMTIIDDTLFISAGRNSTIDSIPQTLINNLLFRIDKLLLVPYATKINKAYQDATWQDMANYKNLGGLVADEDLNARVNDIQRETERHLKKFHKGFPDRT